MATIVFMGTPDFAVPALKALIAEHDVIGVVTQPDRPAGRRGGLRQPPVKEVALAHDIPVFQPEKLRQKDAIAKLAGWQADLFVVAAFGQILPQAVLDMPEFGCLNVHGSLLPRWRGAAPIHAAIRAGDTETGITIMQMDAGLDTGPMLTKRAVAITEHTTGQSLHDKLAQVGAELLIETIPGYINGDIQPQTQPEDGVTYAPQINKSDGLINWADSAVDIDRQVRAYTPWPGTFTYWNGKQLKILTGQPAAGTAPVGSIQEQNGRIVIGTGDGVYHPSEVQLAGKKATDITDFVNGYPDFVGTMLNNPSS